MRKLKLDWIVADQSPTAFYNLCELYTQADADYRALIRNRWDFGRRWPIPKDTHLACNLPKEPPPERRIWASLVYHSIENFRQDYRDNLVSICVIHHAMLRTGLDPKTQFEKVAALSSPEAADIFRGWLRRTPADQSLAAFSFREESTPQGPIFVYLA